MISRRETSKTSIVFQFLCPSVELVENSELFRTTCNGIVHGKDSNTRMSMMDVRAAVWGIFHDMLATSRNQSIRDLSTKQDNDMKMRQIASIDLLYDGGFKQIHDTLQNYRVESDMVEMCMEMSSAASKVHNRFVIYMEKTVIGVSEVFHVDQ